MYFLTWLYRYIPLNGPTGPDQTKSAGFLWLGPVRSGPVGPVLWNLAVTKHVGVACLPCQTLTSPAVGHWATCPLSTFNIYFFYTSYWSYKNDGNLTAVNNIQHFAYYSYYKYQLSLIYPRDKIVL